MGLLQSVGGLRAAAMTWWWSSSGAEPARCPKNLNWKDFTLLETGRQLVILQTVSVVVCLV